MEGNRARNHFVELKWNLGVRLFKAECKIKFPEPTPWLGTGSLRLPEMGGGEGTNNNYGRKFRLICTNYLCNNYLCNWGFPENVLLFPEGWPSLRALKKKELSNQ